MLDLLTKNPFYFVLDGALSAKENMQKDKYIFEHFKKEKPIFRIYEWSDSCSIGISQSIRNVTDEYKNKYAKRITGGGVLFHGNDISYALALPKQAFSNLSVKKSYEFICSFVFEFYKSLSLCPIYAKDCEYITLSKNELCQVGFEPYDILINGKKIGGNAQRRSKNCIFQHGSIPIYKHKNHKDYGHSLEDLGISLSEEEAKNNLLKAFCKTFNVNLKNITKDNISNQGTYKHSSNPHINDIASSFKKQAM